MTDWPPLPVGTPDATQAAAAAVRDYCGWHIAPVIAETLLARGGTDTIVLPTLLVVDVTSVVEDGQPVDPGRYEWWPDGILERTDGRYWGRRIEVTVSHGHDDCPPAVAAVVVSLAKNRVTPQKATAQTAGPYSYSGMSPEAMAGVAGLGQYERDRLAPYRAKRRAR